MFLYFTIRFQQCQHNRLILISVGKWGLRNQAVAGRACENGVQGYIAPPKTPEVGYNPFPAQQDILPHYRPDGTTDC